MHISAIRAGHISFLHLFFIGVTVSKPSFKFVAVTAAELINNHNLNILISVEIDAMYITITVNSYLLTNAKEYNG